MSEDHVTQIARSRELASFVNRFIDEVKNTLCAPWEEGNKHTPCDTMKRTLSKVQDKHESTASSKVLNARMTLGANNSIYLQSGMTMLWSGEMSNDMEYKMYPTSTQTGDLQHAGAAGMVAALHRQLETTSRSHAEMGAHSDYVLAYLLCIKQVNDFVKKVVEDYKEQLKKVLFADNAGVVLGSLNMQVPTYAGGKQPLPMFDEIKALRNKTAGADFVMVMTSIVLSLVSNSNKTKWWTTINTEDSAAKPSGRSPGAPSADSSADSSEYFSDDSSDDSSAAPSGAPAAASSADSSGDNSRGKDAPLTFQKLKELQDSGVGATPFHGISDAQMDVPMADAPCGDKLYSPIRDRKSVV